MSYYEVATGIPPSSLLSLYQRQSLADRYGGCCMCAGQSGGSSSEYRSFMSDMMAKGYTHSQAAAEYRRMQLKGESFEIPLATDRSGTVNTPHVMYQLPWSQSFGDTADADAEARARYLDHWRAAVLSQNR